MTEEQIEERYTQTINIPEESIKNITVLRDDYTFNKLKQYLVSHGIHINDESFYKNFGLITADGKFNILADILADDNMNSIKVAVFKGTDKSAFAKRNEYGFTCLIESLEKVINYCDALNETFIDVSVRPRKEQRLFNDEAFKEAWINACVHNKWSEELSPAVYWFDDRLEIVSYGGIPKNLTKAEFLSGKTEPVNKDLMKIFLQCGIVEHSGHGVPIVVREYGEKAYTFSKNMITVTIPFNKNVLLKDQNVGINVGIKMSDTEQRVIECIKQDNKLSAEAIAIKIGVTERTVSRTLKKLKEKQFIMRIGSNKTGFWKIIQE